VERFGTCSRLANGTILIKPACNSVMFCEEITTIDRDFLARGPVGSLSPKLMEAVVRSIRRAIGEVVTEP